MKLAVFAIAMGGLLSACATTAPTQTAAVTSGQTDYSGLSCRQITAALSSTQRDYNRATGKRGPAVVGEPMASLYAPIAYTSAAPTSAARLKARLDDLQRASRIRRCGSPGPKTATA